MYLVKNVHIYHVDVGLEQLITKYPEVMRGAVTDVQLCRKDIGEGLRLRKWSRGHQFMVCAGGHIDMWQPLYM